MLLFWLDELLFSTIGAHSDEAIHTDGMKSTIVVGAVNESNESLRDQKHVDSRVSIRAQCCVEADQSSYFSNRLVRLKWF